MAYYGIVTEMELIDVETVSVLYDIMDDATDPDLRVMSERVNFAWILRDGNDDIVPETIGQKRTRLQTRFDAEIDAVIVELNQAATQFETLRTQAIGYRHPPA